MKTVLILTASTGEGHNQAADSLADSFKSKGYNTVEFDFIKESNKVMNAFVVDGYKLLATSWPKFYGNLYRISDMQKFNDKFMKHFLRNIEYKVYKLINQCNPDIIIGTHPFSVAVTTKLKETRKINIPFISVVTDFKVHYAYIDKNVDAYITASEYTKESIMERKIPKNKVFSYGIPIRKDFLLNYNNIEIKDSNYFTMLIMGGSMGLSAISRVIKKLLENENDIRIIVVCGNNKTLKRSLEKKYIKNAEYQNIKLEILGFTKDIPHLMEISDVLISKPGGLTTSEAIVKRLPLIIPFAIPGQEQENAEFLVKSGTAIKINKIKQVNEVINTLITTPSILQQMRFNMDKISKNYSIENIVTLSEQLIKRRNDAYNI
ncbi:MAG: glycosyltransferase [Bacillota bacterium]|nr:glycosyltransferase [Bacillota bacterium]